jgi:hypothetical protein
MGCDVCFELGCVEAGKEMDGLIYDCWKKTKRGREGGERGWSVGPSGFDCGVGE